MSKPPLFLQAGLPRGEIPAVFAPVFVPAARARIAPTAPVLGIALGDTQHAFALRLLDGHEVVNDTLRGVPLAVTW